MDYVELENEIKTYNALYENNLHMFAKDIFSMWGLVKMMKGIREVKVPITEAQSCKYPNPHISFWYNKIIVRFEDAYNSNQNECLEWIISNIESLNGIKNEYFSMLIIGWPFYRSYVQERFESSIKNLLKGKPSELSGKLSPQYIDGTHGIAYPVNLKS